MKTLFLIFAVVVAGMSDIERKKCQRNLYENSDLEELSAEKFRSIESGSGKITGHDFS